MAPAPGRSHGLLPAHQMITRSAEALTGSRGITPRYGSLRYASSTTRPAQPHEIGASRTAKAHATQLWWRSRIAVTEGGEREMTRLFNNPADFTEDALAGFAELHADLVQAVPGGVVRATETPQGKVAVVIGGGSGHYPAFCGVVGDGFADGAVVGNIFTSPATTDVLSVARAADGGGGILFSFGNYAGDVMNFGLAQQRLHEEGLDVRTVLVTDDIASAGADEGQKRRGIAGDFVVFKIAGAAAESGYDLDGVERVAIAETIIERSVWVTPFIVAVIGGEEIRYGEVPVERVFEFVFVALFLALGWPSGSASTASRGSRKSRCRAPTSSPSASCPRCSRRRRRTRVPGSP